MEYYLYKCEKQLFDFIANQNQKPQVSLISIIENNHSEFDGIAEGDFVFLFDNKEYLSKFVLRVDALSPSQLNATIIQRNHFGVSVTDIIDVESSVSLFKIEVEDAKKIIDRLVQVNVGLFESQSTKLPTLKKRERTIHSLNRIFYGAPGTGKTYSTAMYAVAICDNKPLSYYDSMSRVDLMGKYWGLMDSGRISFVTFHQSYGYEDFVQGIRPDVSSGGMRFKTQDGVFKIIAEKAMKHPNEDYVIIIDEINRGNISKIFGELITLLEEDKRWGEENKIEVKLPSGQPFAVPNNLYIIGTMNSADKSISLIDAALRRRFEFLEVLPDATKIKDQDVRAYFENLNRVLSVKLKNPDLLIGHSYFMNHTKSDMKDILNNKIIPLLYEYTDDVEKDVKGILVDSKIGDYSLQISDGEKTFSRIRVEQV